jgi:hypothetical protein
LAQQTTQAAKAVKTANIICSKKTIGKTLDGGTFNITNPFIGQKFVNEDEVKKAAAPCKGSVNVEETLKALPYQDGYLTDQIKNILTK